MEFSSPSITPNFMWVKKIINLQFIPFFLFESFSSPQTPKGHPWKVALICGTAVEGRWEAIPLVWCGGQKSSLSELNTTPLLIPLLLCTNKKQPSPPPPLYFHVTSNPLCSIWILEWISLAGYRHPTHTHCCKEDFAKGQQPLSVSAEEKITLNVLGSATSALKCIRSLKETHLGMVTQWSRRKRRKKKKRNKRRTFFKLSFLSSFSSKKCSWKPQAWG